MAAPGSAGPSKRAAVVAIVVGDTDEPVFLKDLRGAGPKAEECNNSDEYLYQFILNASLDLVGERQWQTQNLHLGVVDTFRDYSVSSMVSVSGARILLLHNREQPEANVRNFLKAVHNLWVKIALNPLHGRNDVITNPAFDSRVAAIANKCLGF